MKHYTKKIVSAKQTEKDFEDILIKVRVNINFIEIRPITS